MFGEHGAHILRRWVSDAVDGGGALFQLLKPRVGNLAVGDRLAVKPVEDAGVEETLDEVIEADKVRNELLDKGIIIKDTREGTIYEIKR